MTAATLTPEQIKALADMAERENWDDFTVTLLAITGNDLNEMLRLTEVVCVAFDAQRRRDESKSVTHIH